jgi:tetratricopeptide (TPR) repeat protein
MLASEAVPTRRDIRDACRREETGSERTDRLCAQASASLLRELALLAAPLDVERASAYGARSNELVDTLARTRQDAPARWRHLAHVLELVTLVRSGQFERVSWAARSAEAAAMPPSLRAEYESIQGIAHESASRYLPPPPARPDRYQPPREGAPSTSLRRGNWTAQARLAAARHYRAAIEADPAHHEARLRLGRVLFEQGEEAEAEEYLRAVAVSGCADAVCGQAWLFLGELHQTAGNPETARQSYLSAAAVQDVRPTALLGLLGLAAYGRPTDAASLARLFQVPAGPSGGDAGSAWRRYVAGQLTSPARLIEQLREESGH